MSVVLISRTKPEFSLEDVDYLSDGVSFFQPLFSTLTGNQNVLITRFVTTISERYTKYGIATSVINQLVSTICKHHHFESQETLQLCWIIAIRHLILHMKEETLIMPVYTYAQFIAQYSELLRELSDSKERLKMWRFWRAMNYVKETDLLAAPQISNNGNNNIKQLNISKEMAFRVCQYFEWIHSGAEDVSKRNRRLTEYRNIIFENCLKEQNHKHQLSHPIAKRDSSQHQQQILEIISFNESELAKQSNPRMQQGQPTNNTYLNQRAVKATPPSSIMDDLLLNYETYLKSLNTIEEIDQFAVQLHGSLPDNWFRK